MNKNINLYEILKDCPENTEFYCSKIDQNVKFLGTEYAGFEGITFIAKAPYNMVNTDCVYYYICVNRYGSMFSNGKTPIIFPSKDQRDWSKFIAPWYKKEKFDPKTLKPFDKVLVRSFNSTCWGVQLFSYIIEDEKDYPYLCTNGSHRYCIPYNDDTKHLLGTMDEAPDYYRYWED